MLVRKKDFYLCLTCILFFCAEIVGGGYLLIISVVALSLWGVYCRDNRWTLVFFLLLCQKAFQRVIPSGIPYQLITYMDEIAEVLLLLLLFYELIKGFTVELQERRILVVFLFWTGLTLCSSVVNGGVNFLTLVLDCFVCIKFMVFYQGGRVLSKRGRFTGKDLYYRLNSLSKIFAVVFSVLCVHELFLSPFFEKFDFRYFTESLQFCFLHPTYLAAVCITCITILMCNMKYDQKNLKYIVLLSFVTCLTFRAKAIGALLVIFAIYFTSVKWKLRTKSILLIVAACGVIYFGMDQMEKYFTIGTSVPIRLKMLQDGIGIAQEYFPLGSGFGTFGTTVAFESGSSFYYDLGYMTGYYANQPTGDAFWPGIFAESGWIGTVLFAGVIVLMLADSIRRLKEDKYAGWCMLSILAYAIIASTAETAFFNPATAVMFFVYGIASDRSNDFADTETADDLSC